MGLRSERGNDWGGVLLLVLLFLIFNVGTVSAATHVSYGLDGRFDIVGSDQDIDGRGSTSYSGASISGDDVENALTNDSWINKWLVTDLSDLYEVNYINLSSNFAIKQNQANNTDKYGVWHDVNGDSGVNGSDDYPIYNDLFFANRSTDSLTVKPAMRVGNASHLRGKVFKLKAQKYFVNDYDRESSELSLVPVDEKTLLNSENTQDMLDSALLLPGTDIKIGMQNLDVSAGSADFAIIEGGVVTSYKHWGQDFNPLFAVGNDLELLKGYYFILTLIDPSGEYINFALGKKSDEFWLVNGEVDVLGYSHVVIGDDSGGWGEEFRFDGAELSIPSGSNKALPKTSNSSPFTPHKRPEINSGKSFVTYDSGGKFDVVRSQLITVANMTFMNADRYPYQEFLAVDAWILTNESNIVIKYNSSNTVNIVNDTWMNFSQSPYSDFLNISARVQTDGSNITVQFYKQDIDDDSSTQASSALTSGDDVLQTEVNNSWERLWMSTRLSDIQGSSEIKLSSNFAISQNQTNNSEKYGFWYDATGDGDVKDDDDYPTYNDILFVDVGLSQLTIKPAMRIGDSINLVGKIFNLKSQDYFVKKFDSNDDEITLVAVDVKAFLDNDNTQDMLDSAILVPGTDIKIGMQNMDVGAGSADFAIIEGGVVTSYKHRGQGVDPLFAGGNDLELLNNYYMYLTYIDPAGNYIKLAIGKKTDEFKVIDGDTNVLGYARAVVDDDTGGWVNEFRLEGDYSTISAGDYWTFPLPEGNATPSTFEPKYLGTYAAYTSDKEFDIIRKLSLTVNDSTTLDASREPFSDFLNGDVDVTVTGSSGTVTFTYFMNDFDGTRDSTDDFSETYYTDLEVGKWVANRSDDDFSKTNSLTSWIINVSDTNSLRDNTGSRYGMCFDANGDGDVRDSGDYTIYNDLFIVDKNYSSITVKPAMRIGNATGSIGNVFKLKGQDYFVNGFDSINKDITLIPVSVKWLLNSVNLQDTLDSAYLIPGTNTKIGLQNLTSTPSGTFYVIVDGNVTEVIVRDNETVPKFKIGKDLELHSGSYIIPLEIDPYSNFIKFVIGEKTDEFILSDGDTDVLGYAVARVNPEDSGEFRLEDDNITVSRGSSHQISANITGGLNLLNAFLVFDEDGFFDVQAHWVKSAASGSRIKGSKSPWKDFLKPDAEVSVSNVESGIEMRYEDEDIDNDPSTQNTASGITGDDVAKNETSTNWENMWLVTDLSDLGGASETYLSLDFDIKKNQTNNSEKYGVWYDATGDGDVDDTGDYPIYNDVFFADRLPTTLTIKPAMRIGDSINLVGKVFNLKSQDYFVKKFEANADKLTLVPVDEKTLINTQQTHDMLNSALLVPGTDIKLGLNNLDTEEGSAFFAAIQGGVVTSYTYRDQATDPVFAVGNDLELLNGYYMFLTYIDPAGKFIRLAIGKKSDEFKITDGDTNVLGYARAVVDDDTSGWTNEFRLECDYMEIWKDSSIKLENSCSPSSLLVRNLNTGTNYTIIQAAIDDASENDTISVGPGTYNENIDINKSINLVGSGADVTVINASNPSDHVVEITANWVNVSGFTVKGANLGNSAGIYLGWSDYAKVSSCNMVNNIHGIRLFVANNNKIVNNSASFNMDGFSIAYSNNNKIRNNSAENNSVEGFYIAFSQGNSIRDNIARENGVFDIDTYASTDLECNNIILNTTGSNNLQLKYFNYSVNLQNQTLSQLILCNADNSNITNLTIKGSTSKLNNGLLLMRTDYSNISSINSSYNYMGTYFRYSSNNYLTKNTFNSNFYGINLRFSSNNNTLINNSISNTNQYGIIIESKNDNNSFFHNNIVSNTIQASDNGNNTWDNSYPSGGNYWSDFDDPSEGCVDSNSDYFCDSPRNIGGGGNQDMFPFTSPNGWLNGSNLSSLDLSTGWNMFGVPLDITNYSLPDAIYSISGKYTWLFYFNATTHVWQFYNPSMPQFSDLTELEPGRGYFIQITENATLNFTGPKFTGLTVHLLTRSNMFAPPMGVANYSLPTVLSSIAGSYDWVFYFNATTDNWQYYNPSMPQFSDLKTLEAGRGYFIQMTTDAIWSET